MKFELGRVFAARAALQDFGPALIRTAFFRERGVPMYMAADYIRPTPHKGSCRVRIYRPDLPVEGSAARDEAVVTCTELPANEGMSITNAAEQIAAEVLVNYPDLFEPFSLGTIPGTEYDKPFVWIEHYTDGARGTPSDPATFDLVEFAHYEPRDVLRAGQWAKEIGEPSWSALDRASVEALIGEGVEG